MKKIIPIILAFVLCITLFSCSGSDPLNETMDKAIESLKNSGFTQSQEYNSEQIESIELGFKTSDLYTLNGEILRINHLIKPQNEGFEYVYIYLFENSEDAESILESYAKYTSEYTKIVDRVLIFGSSAQINQLEID